MTSCKPKLASPEVLMWQYHFKVKVAFVRQTQHKDLKMCELWTTCWALGCFQVGAKRGKKKKQRPRLRKQDGVSQAL